MKRKRFHFLNVLLITLNILADNVIYYLLINIPIGLKRVLYIKSSCNNYVLLYTRLRRADSARRSRFCVASANSV